MKIIQRYITADLVKATFLALFVLVALFSFFSLIDQLEEAGKGHYGVPQVLLYVLLTTPKLAYELFPIASVIGSMAVMGMLAQNYELDVIRTSGVSNFALAGVLARSGVILVILSIIIGEVIAPVAEEKAQHMRSVAMTEQITLKTKYGFWGRDGNNFINIRKILPGNQVEQIYFYEFDNDNRLRSSIYAESADYVDGRWLMKNISQSVISEDKVTLRRLKLAEWESLLNPEMINFIIVKPQFLTIWGLVHYISYLKQNAQNSLLYEQALWAKLIRPFSIIAMIVLAVPLVRGNTRFNAVGQRVFIGALIGIVFHICNEIASHLGVVYEIDPSISVTAPTLILIVIIFFLLRERKIHLFQKNRTAGPDLLQEDEHE